MFFSISAMVQALSNLGAQIAELLKQYKAQQAETEIIKDRENLQKASDITEEILWLVQEYMATDSQFTLWVSRISYDLLNKEEKRLYRRFYKNKLKIKNQIQKKHKEFEKVN